MTRSYNKKPVVHDAPWFAKRMARECVRMKVEPIVILEGCLMLAGVAAEKLDLKEEFKAGLRTIDKGIENALETRKEENEIVEIEFGGKK